MTAPPPDDLTLPTIRVTSRELALGTALTDAELAVVVCSSCGAQLEDRYHFDCPLCGHVGSAVSRCRRCSSELSIERISYVAEGPTGGTVTKLLAGVTCRRCAVTGVEQQQLAELDALAALSTDHLEFLPEAGIFTPHLLEVLVDAEVSGPGEAEEILESCDGMTLRVGSPSELFDAALPLLTEQDPREIFSPTLRLEPGPPYAPSQRRSFQLLLARAQRQLGSPVLFWSASVGLTEDALVDPVLLSQLMSWQADRDGLALSLYHAIVADRAPGRFANSVRLLELVLDRSLESGLARARAGSGASAADVVRAASGDLEAKLQSCCRSLKLSPLPILQRLWLTMHPGLWFDEARVYASIAAFPALYVLPFDKERGARLPWEEPDFDGYAGQLRRLASAILDDRADPATALA